MSLPWSEVNSADSRRVAAILRLAKSRERDKFACVSCSSSDALHAYPSGGLKCFSCGRRWSNVDAAAERWGLRDDPPIEALKRLAGELGIYVPAEGPENGRGRARVRAPTPPPPRQEKTPIRASGAVDPELESVRQEIYGEISYLTGISAEARAYLQGRRLDPDRAFDYGFRSISPGEWESVRALLEARPPAHRAASGFYREDGTWAPPFRGAAEVLVIPFFASAADHAPRCIRFRALHELDKGGRYRDLLNAAPHCPFNAMVLEDGIEEAALTEGELDAYALHELGHLAVGFPGTSLNGLSAILPRLRNVPKVVAFFDNDAAGDKAAAKLRDHLQEQFGEPWVRERLVRRRTPEGFKDVGELKAKGVL